MGKLLRVSGYVLGGGVLVVLAVVVFMWLALSTLEAKYSGLSKGQPIEATERNIGYWFHAKRIQWNDIPEIYTDGRVARAGFEIREYSFLGLSGLDIVVVFDEEGQLYLGIPIYE